MQNISSGRVEQRARGERAEGSCCVQWGRCADRRRIAAMVLLPLAWAAPTQVAADECNSRYLWDSCWIGLAPLVSSEELMVWIEDDNIRWNASAAARELCDRVVDPDRADAAVAAIWRGLESRDEQVRNVSAGILQRAIMGRPEGLAPIEPPQRLIELSVDCAVRYRGHVGVGDLAYELCEIRSVAFVERFAQVAAPLLLLRFEEARSEELVPGEDLPWWCDPVEDAQWQLFMAAYLLARVPGVLPIETHVEPLIQALQSNWRDYDALMGMVALDLIGPRAAGPVRRALAQCQDEQQRGCLKMLLSHWEAPPESGLREHAVEELRKTPLTWKVGDPLAEWGFDLQAWYPLY